MKGNNGYIPLLMAQNNIGSNESRLEEIQGFFHNLHNDPYRSPASKGPFIQSPSGLFKI